MKLRNVLIVVKDIQKSVDFYKELEQGFSLLAPMYHFLISGIE